MGKTLLLSYLTIILWNNQFNQCMILIQYIVTIPNNFFEVRDFFMLEFCFAFSRAAIGPPFCPDFC